MGGPGRGALVQGTIAEKDMKNNALRITMANGQGWVQLPAGVKIVKQATVKLEDVQEKQVLTVSGVPTALRATTAVVSDATSSTQAGDAAAGAQPTGPRAGGPGGMGARRGNMGLFAQASGSVAAIDREKKQITLTATGNTTVTVTMDDRTRLVKRLEVGVDGVALGQQFMAFGQADENGVVQARVAGVGDVSSVMGGFGGPGGPGGFGGPGGPGGPPPDQGQ